MGAISGAIIGFISGAIAGGMASYKAFAAATVEQAPVVVEPTVQEQVQNLATQLGNFEMNPEQFAQNLLHLAGLAGL